MKVEEIRRSYGDEEGFIVEGKEIRRGCRGRR